MSLKDSLETGESYYMAEINSIKRILNAKENGKFILCFLDEVLRGTNTVERVAAATEILRYLSGENIITIAATHDIELTYLLEKDYDWDTYYTEIKDGATISVFRAIPLHSETAPVELTVKIINPNNGASLQSTTVKMELTN